MANHRSVQVLLLAVVEVVALAVRPVYADDSIPPSESQAAVSPRPVDVGVIAGHVTGVVVSTSGQPVPEAQVVASTASGSHFAVVADAMGVFRLPITSSGYYLLTSGSTAVPIRAWAGARPPSAMSHLVLTVSQPTIRGEDTLLGFPPVKARRYAIAGAAVVAIAVAVSKDDSSASP